MGVLSRSTGRFLETDSGLHYHVEREKATTSSFILILGRGPPPVSCFFVNPSGFKNPPVELRFERFTCVMRGAPCSTSLCLCTMCACGVRNTYTNISNSGPPPPAAASHRLSVCIEMLSPSIQTGTAASHSYGLSTRIHTSKHTSRF